MEDEDGEVAGAKARTTIYEYAKANGDAMRVAQASLAFEGRSVTMQLECPAEEAERYGAAFRQMAGSIAVIDDLGCRYEVRQTGGDATASIGDPRVFTGVAHVQEDGSQALAYLEMPIGITAEDGSSTAKQDCRLGVIGDSASKGFMKAFRKHEGERVAVVDSLESARGLDSSFGAYQIADAHLAGAESTALTDDSRAKATDTAIGFAENVLARGELRNGEVTHRGRDAFLAYVDPSSDLYEFGDEVEPSVLYQGASLDIAAAATVYDTVGNVYFVDVDRRTYTGEGSTMIQRVSELAVVLNDDGLVQEAYYN